MSKRKVTEPVFIQKAFSKDEIQKGVLKFNRRIDELNNLSNVHHDDQAVDNAVSNLKSTIRDVFGEQSREADESAYIRIWKGPTYVNMSDYEKQKSFSAGIPDTIKLVEGLIQRLKEKQDDLELDRESCNFQLLQGLPIHPEIYRVCSALYEDGHYASAVFEASKALVIMVKEKSGRTDKDGTALMFSEFGGDKPGIAFNDMNSQAEIDEQSGMAQLFAGAVMAVRNPRGHDFWVDTDERALEYICFLSLLAKRLEHAKKVNK